MAGISSFTSAVDNARFNQHINTFEPFHVSKVVKCTDRHRILNVLQASDSMVDVSCANDNEPFSGQPAKREKVDIKVSDFVNAWICNQTSSEHWVLNANLQLYLSQCCIFCSDPSLCDLPEQDRKQFNFLPSIFKDYSCMNVNQINLWMNIHPSQSTLHYDANHNLLVVLEGSKTVTLLSPNCTKHVNPVCSANEHPNHSSLVPQEVDSLVANILKSQGGHGAENDTDGTYAGCVCHEVTIRAGEAIFVPEGWWHQVASEKCTMALNYWFPSKVQELLLRPPNSELSAGGSSVNAYLLRALVHQLVQEELVREEQTTSAMERNLYSDLSFAAFERFILRDLLSLPAVLPTITGRKHTLADDGSQEILSLLAGEEEGVPAQHSSSCWERFVRCGIADMKRFWVPFAAQVRYNVCCYIFSTVLFFYILYRNMLMLDTSFMCIIAPGAVGAGAAERATTRSTLPAQLLGLSGHCC